MDPQTVVSYLTLIPAIVLAITVHEFAHAWTALKFGDPTAYRAGRVTLNPLAHLDPLGTALFFIAGFGWGRPTPVNRSAFTHPRADLVVSAAGPISNILLALVGGLIVRSAWIMQGLEALGLGVGAWYLIVMLVHMNLILAFFNLLPLWPLDGSHVVENLLPPNYALRFREVGRAYGTYVLLGVIVLGRLTGFSIFERILGPPVTFLSSLFMGV